MRKLSNMKKRTEKRENIKKIMKDDMKNKQSFFKVKKREKKNMNEMKKEGGLSLERE